MARLHVAILFLSLLIDDENRKKPRVCRMLFIDVLHISLQKIYRVKKKK